MAKIADLTDLTTENVVKEVLNGNNDKIEAAFQNTLSRDGSSPNQMEADLDLNSNNVLNAHRGDFDIITTKILNVTGDTENAENPSFPMRSLKSFGAVGDGTTDDTEAVQAANTYVRDQSAVLFVEQGDYLFQGTTYSVPQSMWFNNNFYTGVNFLLSLEKQQLLLTASTPDTTPLVEQDARVPINITVEANGANHADCIRGTLINRSTDGRGNTGSYMRAVSTGAETNWSAAQHGETRHAGGTSIGISSETATYTTEGNAYGVVLNNTTNGAESTHQITGDPSVEHPNATACFIQGSRDTGAKGAWRYGLRFAPQSMRTNGVSILMESPAQNHLRIAGTATTFESDILLQADSQNGIILQGDYAGSAIRVAENQKISLNNSADSFFLFDSSTDKLQFFRGASERFSIDMTSGAGGTAPFSINFSGTMKQVTQGDADSAGSGYRILRVEN